MRSPDRPARRPSSGIPRRASDGAALGGVDAVVHLAGETIAGRWTSAKKKRSANSRIEGTRLLSEAIEGVDADPKVFVCASAVGIYGDRGDEELTEKSLRGEGFLADVVAEWEAATAPAGRAGCESSTFVRARSSVATAARWPPC